MKWEYKNIGTEMSDFMLDDKIVECINQGFEVYQVLVINDLIFGSLSTYRFDIFFMVYMKKNSFTNT